MDDAAQLRRTECVRYAPEQSNAVRKRQRTEREAAAQSFTIEPLHGKESLAVGNLPGGHVRDDPWRVQLRQQQGFADEALGLLGAVVPLLARFSISNRLANTLPGASCGFPIRPRRSDRTAD